MDVDVDVGGRCREGSDVSAVGAGGSLNRFLRDGLDGLSEGLPMLFTYSFMCVSGHVVFCSSQSRFLQNIL